MKWWCGVYHCFCPFYMPGVQGSYESMIRIANTVKVEPKAIQYSRDDIIVDLKIPVLYGAPNQSIQNRINASIESDIMEFKNQMEEAAKEHAQAAKQQGKPYKPFVISSVYEVTYNQNNTISIPVLYHEFIGGRHAYIKPSYNFDLTTGRALGLRDLFKPGVNYRQLINNEIRRYIAAHPGMYAPNTLQSFKGIAEDQPFYLEDGNLVIYFGFNEIAPTASQIPVIKIPLFAFQNSLNPSLLGR